MTRPRTNEKAAANSTAGQTVIGLVAVVEDSNGEPLSGYGNYGRGLYGRSPYGGAVENAIPGESF